MKSDPSPIVVPTKAMERTLSGAKATAVRSHRVSTLLWLGFGGITGGAFGAVLGHTLVVFLHYRLGPDVAVWLKGAHGSPFFDLTFATGLFYACIGGFLYAVPKRPILEGAVQGAEELSLSALRWPWKKEGLRGSLIGFVTAFFLMAIPMAAATRLFSWGEGASSQPTLAWYYLISVDYFAANVAAMWFLGYYLRDPRIRGNAFGSLFGALAAYLLQVGILFAIPGNGTQNEIIGWLPPLSTVYFGMLWGGGIGTGIALTSF